MTQLVITPAAAPHRRRLGPVAWLILEELLLDADPTTDVPCAVSVRALAIQLGLDKDTVARGLRRLVDAGLVVRRQARTLDGTFARTTYMIEAPDGLRHHTAARPSPKAPRITAAPAAATPSSPSQLSFLEV